MSRPRWSVCVGGYPNGWQPPVLETNDPLLAIAQYEFASADLRASHARMTTVAIFDDNGEGEPLQPEQVLERLADEDDAQDAPGGRAWGA